MNESRFHTAGQPSPRLSTAQPVSALPDSPAGARAAERTTDQLLGARASLVNRTHRVVRERARSQLDRRTRFKSLWIPLVVCSALLIVLSTGAWMVLAQNDMSPTGIPDASDQMLIVLLWFVPISVALLAMVWFRRSQLVSSQESMQ